VGDRSTSRERDTVRGAAETLSQERAGALAELDIAFAILRRARVLLGLPDRQESFAARPIDGRDEEETLGAIAKWGEKLDALLTMLRSLEWSGATGDGDPCCPECRADAEPWERIEGSSEFRMVPPKHKPGCKLEALIKL
jgi:hypothetical protein